MAASRQRKPQSGSRRFERARFQVVAVQITLQYLLLPSPGRNVAAFAPSERTAALRQLTDSNAAVRPDERSADTR